MVDLLDVAAREFVVGRITNAIQILKDGPGWSFHRCWQAKCAYDNWLKVKMAEKLRQKVRQR